MPSLKFDPSNVRYSSYFDEGCEHLKTDIDDFESDFEWLERQINDYNKSLECFDKYGLNTSISDYFEENGFTVDTKVEVPKEENKAVLTLEFLNILKRFWREKGFSFKYQCKDGYLLINNSITVAKTSRNEDDIKLFIEGLQEHEEIIRNHFNLIDFFNRIKDKAENLSKSIEKNIIMKIEKGTYKTTCEECKNH
jgi:hypothetical protein